jgi:hypothetical protein
MGLNFTVKMGTGFPKIKKRKHWRRSGAMFQASPKRTFSPSGPLVFEKSGFYQLASYFLHRKAFYVHNTTQKDTVKMPSTSRILK